MAIGDFYNNQYTHDLFQETTITEPDVLPLPYLFRSYNQMPALEQRALNLAKGLVLDVGCGAGSHSLYLQQQGLKVTALDSSAKSIEVAQARGVQNAVVANILEYKTATFDTLLLLMNGTGIFEQLANVPQYLNHLKTLLNPGGQILIDSSDLIYMYDRQENGAIFIPAELNYYGELKCILHYKEMVSEPYFWLYLDAKNLERLAIQAGFTCNLLATGENHDYLARLSL